MDNPFDMVLNELRDIKSLMALSGVTTEPTPIYLKIDKAAEFISTTEASLRQMAHRSQVPYIKKQGRLYFRQSDLIEWMESGEIKSEGNAPEDILVRNKKRS